MDVIRHDELQGGPQLRRRLPPIHGRLPWTLRLLERRQQDRDMQESLRTETADFHSNMEEVTLRWEELRVQEAELKDQLLRNQRLILENEVKCRQTEAKARRAREICNQREQQLRVLQESQQSLVKRKQKIQAQIKQYNKFCDFLQCTMEASEEFRSLGDVLGRFYTLVDASHYLQQAVQEAQASIHQTRGQLCTFLKEKCDELLQLDNQLGQLQSNLDEAQNQRLVLESRWMHIQNTATKKTLVIGTIKMAAQNLLHRITVLDRKVATKDPVTQLEMVQQHIQDLTDVYEVTRRQLETKAA
ncbi:coiled-coil domain-containing protein 42-like [Anomaloglossus baeobatrachus]|uniref:coiled-coil domain-containing protein 42-like n=1 Tax=Anomaloglossus baeobatrachus TaxID=238106 RepID=UPI003F50C897